MAQSTALFLQHYQPFSPMPQRLDVNPISEHSLYLRLFVTNSGGV
ncbi:MAG TPA: hypothetical protein VFI31_16105 [Pirellulales bacterium]|nr:hypothetical protein [Pirellulales bacterium]